eukprot:TRINITY_DN3186_c0_g1_i1.p1 TRINITY_DN3186_c0_g1~~TRINITY_DN3186_c0_g1_i1.p1  ORF type:complete len:292 (+),score=150.84 TRINITY_DN3186_c0_g1_i1:50-925(+)
MPARKRAAEDVDDDVVVVEKKAKATKDGKPVHPFFTGGAKKAKAAPAPAVPAGKEVEALWGLMDDGNGWKDALAAETGKPYFGELAKFLEGEYAAGQEVFPPKPDIFAAYNTTHFNDVKVVILGQDPYHDNNQAHGLCFSVLPGIKPPPSLKNMYIELEQDIPGFKTPGHGYLMPWAEQGVLMLNATLTVQAHKANSHAKSGWQKFTDATIKYLSENHTGVVYLLWGGFAQKKGKLIKKEGNVVIECAHPSPLSVTKWRNCKTFSKCNAALQTLGKDVVDWTLPATAAVKK